MKFNNAIATAILIGASFAAVSTPVNEPDTTQATAVNIADDVFEFEDLVSRNAEPAKYRRPARNTGWDSLPGQKRDAEADASRQSRAKYRRPARNTGWDSLPGQKREAEAEPRHAKYRKPARNTGWDSLPGQKREAEAEPRHAKYRKPARNTGWDSLPGCWSWISW